MRDEKTQVEKTLYSSEFLVGELKEEIKKMKDAFYKERNHLEEQLKDSQDKITFFRQNQKLLTDMQEQNYANQKEIEKLKQTIKKYEEERLKTRHVQK